MRPLGLWPRSRHHRISGLRREKSRSGGSGGCSENRLLTPLTTCRAKSHTQICWVTPFSCTPFHHHYNQKKKKEKVNGCPLEMIGETCDLCPSSVWINCVAHARLATIWGVACGRWAASSGWWTVGVSHGPHNKWLYVLVHRWRRRRRTSAVRNRTVPVCGAPFPVLHPTLVLAKSFGILTTDKEALYV